MSPLSDELRQLYQEVILDHYKRPRNFGPLPGADHSAEGYNPLCGDQVKVSVRLEDGRVADAHFEGAGCAISTASASLMTEAVKGKTVEEAEALFRRFHRLVSGKDGAAERGSSRGSERAMAHSIGAARRHDPAAPSEPSGGGDDEDLGKLEVLAGVREFPVRVKCATLAWHTLHNAIIGARDPAKTE